MSSTYIDGPNPPGGHRSPPEAPPFDFRVRTGSRYPTRVIAHDREGRGLVAWCALPVDECPEDPELLPMERAFASEIERRWNAHPDLIVKTGALLDAVRLFVKKDTPTGLMRLNDAMVAARDAVLAARGASTPTPPAGLPSDRASQQGLED